MKTALEITQRMMGIILQHKNDETITRRIYTYLSKERGYCEEIVKPIYPECKICSYFIYNAVRRIYAKYVIWRIFTIVIYFLNLKIKSRGKKFENCEKKLSYFAYLTAVRSNVHSNCLIIFR